MWPDLRGLRPSELFALVEHLVADPAVRAAGRAWQSRLVPADGACWRPICCRSELRSGGLRGLRQQLLQAEHKDNPVDWWHWSAEAERRDVPVLIPVGYAACHWCH